LRKETATTAGNGTTTGNGTTASSATTSATNGGGTVTVTGSLTASGAMTVSGDLKIVGMVESEFLKKLRELAFKTDSDGKQIWPPDSVLGNTIASRKLLSQEFMDAWDALFMLEEKLVPVPTDGAPGSAKALIKDLIDATHWPLSSPTPAPLVPVPVPEPWNTGPHQLAFRRYEVTCAMDILMRAFRNKGAGTGGENTGVPPER
jgi:hypothetical protein